MSPDVVAAFDRFPDPTRARLLRVRDMIVEQGNGSAEESLKWGQPSYATRFGTPIRLGQTKSGLPAVYVHCQTTLVSEFRDRFPDAFGYEGNRALVLSTNTDEKVLRLFIQAAQNYRKRGQ